MGHRLISLSDIIYILRTLLVPHQSIKDVCDIDLEVLKEKGFTTFLVDLDNTLLSNSQRDVLLTYVNWVQKSKDMGFDIFIFSNNRSKKRVARAADQLQCHAIYMAMKPFSASARQLSNIYNFDLKKTVVIGDQVFKDIVLANWIRSYGILVEPLDETLSLGAQLQYTFERYLVKRLDLSQ